MLIKLRLLACATALLAATAANATTYQFSYDFLNGASVSGSFDGTATGNLVNDVSNVAFSVNHVAITGPIIAANSSFSGAAVFSFNGLANDFLLLDSTFQNVLLSGAFQSPVTNVVNYSTPLGSYAEGPDVDPYSAARWNLKVAGAVPEPTTFAMLLGGLALIGAVTRRRNAVR